ncbi:cytochrome-c peroxidase [Enterovibrio nigricans]|uniref:Cytochrome c peroxidase n=1 Tax=Enterovibrio nigricans DSM 22720 TaxID=1121868 RepID=A0A1T4W952_9GAMM|nr:cytochrome c peroxidase [Enterovibrio nigricans]SKA73802.1 cytochrome c peroxidase [Enterovibrio nigricans DSM 22720]
MRVFKHVSTALLAVGLSTSATMAWSQSNNSNIDVADHIALEKLIDEQGLRGNPAEGRVLPAIDDPLAQLGKKLFFTKGLSGDKDVACVSCHHPMLGGSDELSLPVGVNAARPEVLGVGRIDGDSLPDVPRNSPTVFNLGLWDTTLFWDSRLESLGQEPGQNGAASPISTPDSGLGIADPLAGPNLATAQARFPVTSQAEMRDTTFEAGSRNEAVRQHLAARLGDYGIGQGELAVNHWLAEFQQAFNLVADAETLITYENIALAIGEYERSMVFVNSPWQQYVDGNRDALNADQVAGATMFLTRSEMGGGGCTNCHSGTFFTDGETHAIGFPQIGVGKGVVNDDDFGREMATGNSDDRYRFRTPGLLNVEVTKPYGHAGAYQSLKEVVDHHVNPTEAVKAYFAKGGWCALPQFDGLADCENVYPHAVENTKLAVEKTELERAYATSKLPYIWLSEKERWQLVAFLEALTDPCVKDRACMSPWIADQSDNVDNLLLIATDVNGTPL